MSNFENDIESDNHDLHELFNQNDDHQQKQPYHRYPPYYFTQKYLPSFAAWLMQKDDNILTYDGDNDYNDDNNSEGAENEEGDGGKEKYSSRKQLIAFLLSFFLGSWGVGRFYAGSYVAAALKLTLDLIVTGFRCTSCCVTLPILFRNVNNGGQIDIDSEELRMPFWWIWANRILSLALIIWIITDIILFALNKIPDEDGLKLEPW